MISIEQYDCLINDVVVYIDVNGKTIHVVQRSPPSARAASASGAASSAAEAGPTRGERSRMDGSSFVVGSFSLPPDATDVNQVHVSMLSTAAHFIGCSSLK